MTEIQGKSILVRVSARFELARVQVIGSRLCVKFAYHFRINYDLNFETAEFFALGLCDFGETLFNARY